jgi:NhaP-type Na+/H+ and K+/H+ antiporter
VRALLELESGSNDPMAVFLTMTVIRLITSPSTSVSDLISMFVRQMALGASLGYGLGRAIIFLVNRMRLEYEGLYPVLTLSWFSSPTAPPPGSEATGSWPSTSPDWSWATVPSFTSEA